MKVIFSKPAKLELEDAVIFYELECLGLGKRFKQEVQKAIKRIIAYPNAWSIEQGGAKGFSPLRTHFPLRRTQRISTAVGHLTVGSMKTVGRSDRLIAPPSECISPEVEAVVTGGLPPLAPRPLFPQPEKKRTLTKRPVTAICLPMEFIKRFKP